MYLMDLIMKKQANLQTNQFIDEMNTGILIETLSRIIRHYKGWSTDVTDYNFIYYMYRLDSLLSLSGIVKNGTGLVVLVSFNLVNLKFKKLQIIILSVK